MHKDLVRPSGTPVEGMSVGLMAPDLPGTTPMGIHIMGITVTAHTITGLRAMGPLPIAVGIGGLTSIVGAISSRQRRAATEALITVL
jgi:hypothetical protein